MDEEQIARIDSIEELLAELRRYVDSIEIYPRTSSSADLVLLGLLSKAFRLSEAVIQLVRAGFYEEAYGMARSSLEIRFLFRNITNEENASSYRNFSAKIAQRTKELANKYLTSQPTLTLPQAIEDQALPYRHRWTEDTIKKLAERPHAFEVTEDGTPSNQLQTYEVVYWLMSSFVHVDVSSLESDHWPAIGVSFKVSSSHTSQTRGVHAVEVSARTVGMAIDHAWHFFGIDVPQEISERFKVLL